MPRTIAKRSNTLTGQRDAVSQAAVPTNRGLQPHPELVASGAVNDSVNETKSNPSKSRSSPSDFRASKRFASGPESGFTPEPVSLRESLDARMVEESAFLDPDYQVLEVMRPTVAEVPIVISCPHAGRDYPETMMNHVPGGIDCLRGLEDFAVDRLLDGLPACGAPVLINRVARAYIDVSRSATALDRSMFDGEVNASHPCKHVCSGYGLLPRLTAERQNIYDGLLHVREAAARTRKVHRPYHSTLAGLIERAKERHGRVILLDVHSMPQCDHFNRKLPDIVCGDVHGKTLSLVNREFLTEVFEEAGLCVGWNDPYSGGYITKAYGKARGRCQAVQIEINRRLYMNGCDELNFRTVEFLARKLGEIASRIDDKF